MRKGWEIVLRDTTDGHCRRFRVSAMGLVCLALCSVLILGCSGWFMLGTKINQSESSEISELKQQLAARNAQMSFFADRMGVIRAELASVRRLSQTVEQQLGRGEIITEGGLGGTVKATIGRDAKRMTYFNYESELLDDMWTEVEELEAEARLEHDRTVLLTRFLDTRKGLISALPSIRPIDGGFVSSPFGRRRDPFTGAMKMHTGLDLAHSSHVPVYATADGVVTQVQRSQTYGRVIGVYHGYGVYTLYAHLHRQDVRVGDRVKCGQTIGLLGNTGRSTHRHLHYEVRIEGRQVNPYYFIPKASR